MSVGGYAPDPTDRLPNKSKLLLRGKHITLPLKTIFVQIQALALSGPFRLASSTEE